MDSIYKEDILDHYKHPRNFGELDAPDVHVEANHPLCGDRLSMDLHLKDGVVEDVRFKGRGCAISQASASMLTEQMVGKSLEELAQMTKDDILENLGVEVSYARLKCALLSLDMLRASLAQAGIEFSENEEE